MAFEVWFFKILYTLMLKFVFSQYSHEIYHSIWVLLSKANVFYNYNLSKQCVILWIASIIDNCVLICYAIILIKCQKSLCYNSDKKIMYIPGTSGDPVVVACDFFIESFGSIDATNMVIICKITIARSCSWLHFTY